MSQNYFNVNKVNYLAHLYLSGNDEEVLVGNFIADAVKGNNLSAFTNDIQKGITLHRKIDYYTDHHPLVIEINKLFAPGYGKYAGIVTDMLFDHLLAQNWEHYHQLPLKAYVNKTNALLLSWFHIMPLKLQRMMPFWVKNRWPEIYSTEKGLIRALNGMPRYTSLPKQSDFVLHVMQSERTIIHNNFKYFFEALQKECYNGYKLQL